jgi:hypothetical protein
MRGDPDGISGFDNVAPPRDAEVAVNAPVRLLDRRDAELQQAAPPVEARVSIERWQPPARDDDQK